MKVHVCPLDAECRAEGHPWRVYVFMKSGMLIIALRWSARTQLWLPWTNPPLHPLVVADRLAPTP